VRRVSLFFLVLSLSLGAAGVAQARERLLMPFACDLQQGRIKLTPAVDKTYAIVGKREVASVTTCRSPRSTGCRTMMVHRFVISCGEAGVAWMRVAAAIRQANAAPAWIDDGRLNMVLPVHDQVTAHAPCMERPTFALGGTGLERRVAYTGNCGARRDDFDHIVLPAGFAPIEELGARLVDVAAAAEAPAIPDLKLDEDLLRHVAAADNETVLARADPDVVVEPIPGLEPYDAEIEPALASDDWVTVVRTEHDAADVTGSGDGDAPGPLAWLLAAMAFATAAGLIRLRSSEIWPDGLQAVSPALARFASQLGAQLRMDGRWRNMRGGRSTPESFINAGAAVKALLAQTETVVSELKGGGPLREVLQSELRLVRQALRSVEAAARDGGEDEARTALRLASQYRALVREMERIRRIAESAAASLSGTRPAGSVPRTTSEAYDVLGVNPDVSEGVLKKIVDALRMSWHPDHARSDEDRLVREDRMRQINIAWDLINGAREVA
jgi:hypothetical protein